MTPNIDCCRDGGVPNQTLPTGPQVHAVVEPKLPHWCKAPAAASHVLAQLNLSLFRAQG